LGLLLSEQGVRSANGLRREALSDLLPHLEGRFTALRQKINLAAFGFTGFPGVPEVVGPFNVVDARVGVTETLLGFEAYHKEKAGSESVAAARYSFQDTRDLVVLVCGSLYMRTLADESRIEAARAQLDTARALHQLAADRKQAGLVPAVDLLRAELEEQARQE